MATVPPLTYIDGPNRVNTCAAATKRYKMGNTKEDKEKCPICGKGKDGFDPYCDDCWKEYLGTHVGGRDDTDNNKMIAYKDPNHPGNSEKYHTGKKCIEPGCENPAGTAWSPFWCFTCNVKRIERVDGQLRGLFDSFKL